MEKKRRVWRRRGGYGEEGRVWKRRGRYGGEEEGMEKKRRVWEKKGGYGEEEEGMEKKGKVWRRKGGYGEEEEGMEKKRGTRGEILMLHAAANSASSMRERASDGGRERASGIEKGRAERKREPRVQQTDREIETHRRSDAETREKHIETSCGGGLGFRV